MDISEETYDVGVIVGRFQVPALHDGHRELIDHVRANHDWVVILLGVSPLATSTNDPLNYGIRQYMIQEAYPNIQILPVIDIGDNDLWSKNLDTLINGIAPTRTKLLYGGRDSFLKSYSGKLPTRELVQKEHKSGTEIRKNVARGMSFPSEEFRRGLIFGSGNRFPTVYTCVDIAVINSDHAGVLLGRKPLEDKWRFPGGFADVNSYSFEDDAYRQIKSRPFSTWQ